MSKLGTELSSAIADELGRQLGDARAMAILGVSNARWTAIHQGRGRLSEEQLDAMAAQTGRSWTCWVADAGARLATSDADRELVEATRALFASNEGVSHRADPPAADKDGAAAADRPARPKSTAHRPASRRRRNPAA